MKKIRLTDSQIMALPVEDLTHKQARRRAMRMARNRAFEAYGSRGGVVYIKRSRLDWRRFCILHKSPNGHHVVRWVAINAALTNIREVDSNGKSL